MNWQLRWSSALASVSDQRQAYESIGIQPIAASDLTESLAAMFAHAAAHLPEDFLRALRFGFDREESDRGQAIYRQLLDNANAAASAFRPTCQDTGQAVVFVDIGQQAQIVGGSLEQAVNTAVVRGYGKLRSSIVRDALFERKNTGDNTPAVIHVRSVPGHEVTLHIAEKGFGSENKSFMVMYPYPGGGEEAVVSFVLKHVEKAGAGWCPPGMLSVAVGGNFETAPLLAKRALLEPFDMDRLLERAADNPEQLSANERLRIRLFEEVNKMGIGPQGLGGTTTVLDVKLTTAPTHIAGLPIAVNVQCNKAHHLSVTLDGSGPVTSFAKPNVASFLPPKAEATAEDAKRVQLPLDEATRKGLRAGDRVLLNGKLLTGRDAAHKRLIGLLDAGEPLPVSLENQLVYYVGPINPVEGEVVGPAGPTTASRMDPYTPRLLEQCGLAGTIGKGERGPEVAKAVAETETVYFIATGGAAYQQSKSIRGVKVLAFEELGTEAIRELEVVDFPAVVAIDSTGNNLHETGREAFAKA